MYKKNSFLIIFFALLSIFSLLKLYDHALTLATFEYGEWLINYQHGFVRRGLVGEIIYLFSILFNNNIQITFFIIISFICLLYYFFVDMVHQAQHARLCEADFNNNIRRPRTNKGGWFAMAFWFVRWLFGMLSGG